MRFRWIVTLAVCSVVTMTLALGVAPPVTSVHSQETGDKKSDDKKSDNKKTDDKTDGVKIDKLDEDILRRADLSTDGEALRDFLKKRILPESERPEIDRLVRRLGSADYRMREKATLDLLDRGVAALEVLRASAAQSEIETLRRVQNVIQRIHDKDVAPEVPAAAVRVCALRKPAGLTEVLIGYLPFTDNNAVLEEVRAVLVANALKAGKADPLLVSALTDRAAIRRAVAAEALGLAAFADHKDAIRKLLGDPDALVRYRVARTLAFAKERDAIPTLIDTLPDLPLNTAWQAEDFLLMLAAGVSPPETPMGNDKATRNKCKDGWQAWWKTHGAKIGLAKLEDTPKLLGRTLIILLDQSKIIELGPDNLPRWTIDKVVFPLDVQLIGEDRVLVAEYHGNRVTERDKHGEIKWQKAVIGPLAAQRLPNGNTFVANDHQLLEFDKDGNEVININFPDEGRKIMKAMKLANGEIACMMVDARIVRFDAQGKELSSFPIIIGMRLFGGRIHVQPSGRALVPHNAEGKVAEYDSKGKIIWEVPFEQPIAAVRLANGNTMITSMNPAIGAVEVDRAGVEVWSYRDPSNTRVTRAIRR